MIEPADWDKGVKSGFLASGIDPGDRKGHKNYYIDLLQKIALEETLELKGNEIVLDFGCGSGRLSSWVAPLVKKVIGLEVSPEMVDLAERNRTAKNVEFILYDGFHFPVFPYPFDLLLSVGVLQLIRRELLIGALSSLAQYLKKDGMFYLIEQVSDSSKVDRPSLKEYLDAFGSSKMECLQHYPIRNGRWWMLYLIRYGMIPKRWFGQIAHYELEKRRRDKGSIRFYEDFLFLLRKG